MVLEGAIIWVYCWTDDNVTKILGNKKLTGGACQRE